MLSVESLLAYGPVGLFIVAFTESTVFPIPPDVMLLPLAMMNPRLSWWYAFLTSAASALGALLGYAIGRKAGRPILRRFFKEETIKQVEPLFVKYGGWAVGIAAFTPLPFKIFTFGAGIFRVPILTFTVVTVIGRSARFFLEAALVYFLGNKAQVYLGRNFEIATLGLTASLLLITWLLPKMIPSVRKAEGEPAGGSWVRTGSRRMAQCLRKLGPRVLAWGAAAAVFAVSSAAFLEDVIGPERHTLNATLGPAFTWFGPGRDSVTWKVVSSPWVLFALAVAGFAVYLGPVWRDFAGKDPRDSRGRYCAAGVVAGLAAVAVATDALVRGYLPGVFGPAGLLIPYLPAVGLYLLDYRRSSGLRRMVALMPGALAATALTLRFVADGRFDPAAAVLSLLCSAFMLCLTMSALSALSLLSVRSPAQP